jgi:flagellar biosynthesis protein FlhF
MKIKRYRAASMREALQQVKQELGDEALVLETKTVRAGGLFGVGARALVELRVAVDPALPPREPKGKQRAKKPLAQPRAPRSTGITTLNLTEDSSAVPARAADTNDPTSVPAFAALAARAYASDGANSAAALPHYAVPDAPANGIELAETAPRLVHRPPPATAAPPAAKAATQASSSSAPPPATFRGELEQLRAELREVKFSLSALATRPIVQDSTPQEARAAFDAEPEMYDSPYYEAYLELTTAGLQPELARKAVRAARASGLRDLSDTSRVARAGLTAIMPTIVRFGEDPLAAPPEIVKKAFHPGPAQAPEAVAFIGPTGVGKTTTIAKLAARVALRQRRRVELITLDTYRIAAVEQLKTYAEIIGAGCHIARSVMELDALARRYAGQATVLIDTVGRSPHDLADQLELADYLRANQALLKCLVLQATTHPTDAHLAIRKFELYGANRLILTKLDETGRPGAAMTVAAHAALPLIYLCAGQRVPEDLERATPLAFAARVLRTRLAAAAA